ncbi:MAG: LPXTG cell wall anchor domain-containing protein [Atopobiaceae bacterium]|nr:LPXTG cell wall anchor domain-containing protein [Atopobiaceae bacterium]
MPALANATLLLWSTWTPVEDLPYPEDDDRGIIDAHKDQHAEVDFGAGTYGSMTSHKLGERDDAGWFTYDGVGPTVGAEHKGSYEPDPYALLIWPAPYLYTHPAEYHGVKDPAEAFYYFNLRSDLDETSSNVSSLAFEYGTDQYEDNDWGKEPAVFTDVETGVVEIVVPLHRRDYTELPLTGMTPDRVLPFAGLALVVVGSGALAVYRRKTAQKAA